MPDHARLFERFRQSLNTDDVVGDVRAQIIGRNAVVDGPFGPKPLLYADYVASGRALASIEKLILEEVLPYYANSHSEASYCGAAMTGLRRAARAEIAALCGAEPEHAVIFAGSGATAGLNRLVHMLGVRQAVESGRGASVLIGPYEHHSNILPWRESGATVIEIPEAADGGPDQAALSDALNRSSGLVVGAFSAASNVTGILTDVVAVTTMLKAAGALAVWDYAGGGPYLPISMTPAPDAPLDAIVVSPHKFVGGPGASGVLIVRKDAVVSQTPTFPGGGTVRFVSSWAHDYSTDISEREEGGTPNIIGDIRAALVFIVKDAIGQPWIAARDTALAQRALAAWQGVEYLRILGKTTSPRLPIFSFLVRSKRHRDILHPHHVTRLLSDRFGIQARGGCACAGPYGHALLKIDRAASEAMRAAVLSGREEARPGFVRLNLSYLLSDDEADQIIGAVLSLPQLADEGCEQNADDTSSEVDGEAPKIEELTWMPGGQ